jgi:hypothetical protein
MTTLLGKGAKGGCVVLYSTRHFSIMIGASFNE